MLPVLAALLTCVYGCAENGEKESGEETLHEPEAEEYEPAAEEDLDKTGAIDIELGEYISEDGKIAVEIYDYMHAEHIPEKVGAFFAQDNGGDNKQGENGEENKRGAFFESSRISLQQDDVYYLALFMVINDIEEGFLKVPHSFNGEQPVLLTAEGTAHERIITQFKYIGTLDAYFGSSNFPPGSEGVVVFAYPTAKTPEEIHYVYSLERIDSTEAEKGTIVVSLP